MYGGIERRTALKLLEIRIPSDVVDVPITCWHLVCSIKCGRAHECACQGTMPVGLRAAYTRL